MKQWFLNFLDLGPLYKTSKNWVQFWSIWILSVDTVLEIKTKHLKSTNFLIHLKIKIISLLHANIHNKYVLWNKKYFSKKSGTVLHILKNLLMF